MEAAREPSEQHETTPAEQIAALRKNVSRVVRGKESTVELALTALFAGGHILLEDIPGVGKTLLALSLARSIRCPFRRIQFTNDTIPADILGSMVYSRKDERFRFVPGPIFAGVLLADEINRTSPKTQSALLEAMTERRVTVENEVHPLPEPFLVIATQNPIDHHGTFPLPENQLDRFLLRTSLGYPDREAEREILRHDIGPADAEQLAPVLDGDDIARLRYVVRRVHLDPSVLDYILALADATRNDSRLRLGVSPRGALMLKQSAQALAFLRGRSYVTPDDIKALTEPVWAHRILTRSGESQSDASKRDAQAVLTEILDRIPVPV